MFRRLLFVGLLGLIIVLLMIIPNYIRLAQTPGAPEVSPLGACIGAAILWSMFMICPGLPLFFLLRWVEQMAALDRAAKLMDLLMGGPMRLSSLGDAFASRWNRVLSVTQLQEALRIPFDKKWISLTIDEALKDRREFDACEATLLQTGVFEVQRMRREGTAGLSPPKL